MTASTLDLVDTTESVSPETPEPRCFVQNDNELTRITLTGGMTAGMALAAAGVVIPDGYTPLMNSRLAQADTPVVPDAYLSFAPNLSNG